MISGAFSPVSTFNRNACAFRFNDVVSVGYGLSCTFYSIAHSTVFIISNGYYDFFNFRINAYSGNCICGKRFRYSIVIYAGFIYYDLTGRRIITKYCCSTVRSRIQQY